MDPLYPRPFYGFSTSCSSSSSKKKPADLRRKRSGDDIVLDLANVTLSSECGAKKARPEVLQERQIKRKGRGAAEGERSHFKRNKEGSQDDSFELELVEEDFSGTESPSYPQRSVSPGEDIIVLNEEEDSNDLYDELALLFERTSLVMRPVIDVVRVTDGGLVIAQKSFALDVNPHESLHMTDEQFVEKVMMCSDFSHLIVHQAKFLTDEAFETVLTEKSKSNSSQLYKFSVAHCPNMTDATLYVLADTAPRLTEFSIMRCPITNNGVVAVANKCPHLEVVNLDRCFSIANASLEALGKCCQELREFTCMGCREITFDGFSALVEGCQKLERIELTDCEQVTDDWLLACMAKLNNLTELDIKGCPRVTQEAIQLVRNCFPKIVLLHSSK